MKKILFIGGGFPLSIQKCFEADGYPSRYAASAEQAMVFLHEESALPCLVLFSLNHDSTRAFMQLRYFMLKQPRLKAIPFVAISGYPSARLKGLSIKFRAHGYITPLNNTSAVCTRLKYLASQDFGSEPPPALLFHPANGSRRHPAWKRLFDMCGALALLLILSPVFILVALLIKLESKGPILYISKRAGQGYKIFDFYKFRSMRADAEQQLDTLQQQNKYRDPAGPAGEPPAFCRPKQLLVQDNGFIAEGDFMQKKAEQKAGTFVKIKNDPRTTRAGRLIRATSIDELPQLFNVLKGDMSLVGNRPVPLYEAERLTSDEHIARFFAPAGITGLWQVTKNRRNSISEEERKLLDIEYARSYNFWMDLRILLKTLPAALQHEKA